MHCIFFLKEIIIPAGSRSANHYQQTLQKPTTLNNVSKFMYEILSPLGPFSWVIFFSRIIALLSRLYTLLSQINAKLSCIKCHLYLSFAFIHESYAFFRERFAFIRDISQKIRASNQTDNEYIDRLGKPKASF